MHHDSGRQYSTAWCTSGSVHLGSTSLRSHNTALSTRIYTSTVRPRYTADRRNTVGRAIPPLFLGDTGCQNANAPVSGIPPVAQYPAAFLELYRGPTYALAYLYMYRYIDSRAAMWLMKSCTLGKNNKNENEIKEECSLEVHESQVPLLRAHRLRTAHADAYTVQETGNSTAVGHPL
jgi:hypothetical protein